MATRVMDYDSGDTLDGDVSDELRDESAAADPTGAVPAYRDDAGTWQYVAPSQVEHARRNLCQDVRTVWVES